MEEIDIIELLKRLKEGKAPKVIEIGGNKYYYNKKWNDVFWAYLDSDDNKIFQNFVDFDTKIKILDKPILEELKEWRGATDVANKLNEVIRYLKSKEKK